MKHVAIIGNGVAGTTAARYIRKLSDHKITVISSESKYFWSRTALMYIYMGHMKFPHTKPYEDWFWPKNKIDLVYDYVKSINAEKNQLNLQSGSLINYDYLIIASGSAPKKIGCPGEDLQGVSGMVSLQDLQYIEEHTKNVNKAVVVGGGLIGIELTEMLMSSNIDVSFLVREKSFWNTVLPLEESHIVNNHILKHKVDLQLCTGLKEITGDENGRVKSIITTTGIEMNCDFVGITIGVEPQISFLEGSGIRTDRGVLVDSFLKTNIANIYAAGDCVQHAQPPEGRKEIEQIWYSGRIQGEAVARNICENPLPYNPGIFFNSAKFLAIEYQTYGFVPPSPHYGLQSFIWEEGEKLLRIIYYEKDLAVTGVNLLGLRFRQDVCEQWINDKTPLPEVIINLQKANFNPEFSRKIEGDVIEKFFREFPAYRPKDARKKILGVF